MEQSEDCDMLLSLTGSGYSLNQIPVKASSFNNLVEQLFNPEIESDSMDVDIQKDFARDSQASDACLKQWNESTTDGADKSSTSSLQLPAPQQAQSGGVTNLAHRLEDCPSGSSVHVTYMPELLHQTCGSGVRNGTTQESEPKLPGEIHHMPSLAIFQIGARQEEQHQSQSQQLMQLGQLSPDDIDDLLSPPSPSPRPIVLHVGQFVGAETLAIEEEAAVEMPELPVVLAPQDVSRTAEPLQAAADLLPAIEKLKVEPLQAIELLKVEPLQAIELLKVEPLQVRAPQVSDLQAPSPNRDDSSLERMAEFIVSTVRRYHNIGASVSSNGKIQVHEVVLILLLAPYYRSSSFLGGVMSFSNKEGREAAQPSGHFVAKDTKTIGRLWQKLKKNSNANYDTFARAMRVGRERNKEYFDYLDAGKGAKKRVYKLGPKCLKEFDRMRDALQALD